MMLMERVTEAQRYAKLVSYYSEILSSEKEKKYIVM